MFGKAMSIDCSCGTIHLKPYEKEEVASKRVCKMLSDYEVTRYLVLEQSPTVKDEEEWYEKARKDNNTISWGIYLDDSKLLGNTSIRLDSARHVGYTGFMLFDKSYWRRGIASTSHIARTYYAVQHLDVKTILSCVFSPNIGSLKALQNVGYFISGYQLGTAYIDGIHRYMTHLQWIRPEYKDLILKDGVPEELTSKVNSALIKAQKTLEFAEKNVRF